MSEWWRLSIQKHISVIHKIILAEPRKNKSDAVLCFEKEKKAELAEFWVSEWLKGFVYNLSTFQN